MKEIVLDTETTGLSIMDGHRIVEIGCIELEDLIPTKNIFHCYLNPERKVSEKAFEVHGYSDEFLSDKKKFKEIANDFLDFIGDKKIIIHNAEFDIGHLNNELSKLKSLAISKKKIDLYDIQKLSNLAENYSVFELSDNYLAKNSKKVSNMLNENNYTSDDCILILRTILNKSKRLLKIKSEMDKTKNIDEVLSTFKPPIFWKEKEIVKKQAQSWSTKEIKKIIYKINDLELIIKKNSTNSLNFVSDFILNY